MFKVVYKDVIIDVLENPVYCKSLKSGSVIRTEKTSANCVLSSDGSQVYHLRGTPEAKESYKTVMVFQFAEGEKEEANLSEIKKRKIAEMSAESEKTIHAGTDITLSDGNTYHFSFSDQDQFQIGFLATGARTAQMMEAMGCLTYETGKDYPWHADGGDCIFYSRFDMITIGTVMQNYITYHNSYFHAVRNYIDALTNPLTVIDLYYGAEVPQEYWGEVFNHVV